MYIEKSLRSLSSAHEKLGKNKSVAFKILFSVIRFFFRFFV